MHEADPLPLRDQARGAPRHFGQQGLVRVRLAGQLRIVRIDHIVGQRLQLFRLVAVEPVLERAEAHEARRHAGDDGRRFDGFAHHALVGTGNAQRAGGRDAKRGHGFRAQEFADRRAQHGAAVAHARVRGQPGALELQLHRPGGAVQFTDQDRAAVAQLAGPDAELVAGIHRRQRLRARRDAVAGQQMDEVVSGEQGGIEPDQGGRLRAGRDKIRRRQGRRHQPGIERRGQGRKGVAQREFVGSDGDSSLKCVVAKRYRYFTVDHQFTCARAPFKPGLHKVTAFPLSYLVRCTIEKY